MSGERVVRGGAPDQGVLDVDENAGVIGAESVSEPVRLQIRFLRALFAA
jgi:hypothetical protein